ncbi:glycosyltransferase family 4 protein [Pontiellaceae bacterium B12219]|nr:glycosyltransferase family 4 protein [Pontiellaceae bacterium B12219]
MLHNFYQHRGGEGVAFAVESQSLRDLGHVVDIVTLDNAVDLPQLNPVRLALRTIWSISSYRKIRNLLNEKSYDVLHVHNFFPLFSPAVYDAARSCGVPVVQTLHNYRLFCMQTGLFRDGRICEECPKAGNALLGIRHRCYRGSLPASLACGAMLEWHRFRKTWLRKVDAYIAVSECVKQKYVSNGWNSETMFVKHNTVTPVPEVGSGEKNNFVTVGRLSEDKGLLSLLDAWEWLAKDTDGVPNLVIIGDGPLRETIEREILTRELSHCVTLTGRLSLDETYTAMGSATATVLPSVRFEPCSRSIAESFAKGTPVIAAKIGGAEELLDDSVNGFHYPPGDASALAEIVKKLATNPDLASEMRQAARQKFDTDYHPQKDVKQLVEIYSAVLN